MRGFPFEDLRRPRSLAGMNRVRMILLTLCLAVFCRPALAEDRFMGPAPAMGDFEVRKDIVYRESADASRAFDLYLPAKHGAPVPLMSR